MIREEGRDPGDEQSEPVDGATTALVAAPTHTPEAQANRLAVGSG